jgi:hypothetical protein
LIAQVLNRDFVLKQLEDVRDYLTTAATDDRRRGSEEGPELSPEDAAQALEAAQSALQTEAAVSSGQPGFEPPPAERRGEEPAPIDDFSFFSRDATISNLQSALEQYFREQDQVETAPPADDRRGGGDEDVAVTDVSLPDWQPRRDEDNRRVFDKFSTTDPRWVSSLFAEGIRRFKGKHAFPEKPAEPLTIGNQARLVLVGDWGSGIPRARKVADQMRKILDEGLAANREQHAVHLGDVYYSGWEYEYRDRFLAFWPVKPDEAARIPSWNLNGNHDMYSGGHAFFDYALKDPRFARQQGSSRFSLRNDHWTILGLDTAWDEHDLHGDQDKWAQGMLESAPGKGMLLSHHQIFSAYETGKNKLIEKIRPVLKTGRVRSWFWGHEHRCVLYDPTENVEYARCVGHGGVPVYMTHKEGDPYPPPASWEFRDFIRSGLECWALFGFAVLDFDGPKVTVRYIDENGKENRREELA